MLKRNKVGSGHFVLGQGAVVGQWDLHLSRIPRCVIFHPKHTGVAAKDALEAELSVSARMRDQSLTLFVAHFPQIKQYCDKIVIIICTKVVDWSATLLFWLPPFLIADTHLDVVIEPQRKLWDN